MSNGNRGDDDHIDESRDNIGNRADGPPTHDGPRPPRFAGEGQSRRQRLGFGADRPRRSPRRGEPDGNVAPSSRFGGQPRFDQGSRGDQQPNFDPQARADQAPRGDQQPRFDQAPRGDQQPRFEQGPRRERGPRRGRRGGQSGQGGQGGNRQGGYPPGVAGDAPAPGAIEGGQLLERGPRPFNDRSNDRGHGGRDRNRGARPPRDPQQQQQPRDDRPRGGIREDETKVYGFNACMAVFEKRPDAVIRAYVNNDMLRRFGYTMKFLAEQRRAYHVVTDDELRRVTDSDHHGGVCFVIRKRAPLELIDFLRLFGEQPRCRAVMLEGVGNPHNIGAVLRSCAHFGVDAVLVEDGGFAQGGAAARVAEGATETLRLVQYRGSARALEILKQAGFTRVVTSSHASQPLYEATLPEKAVFVFGAEGTGVSAPAGEASDLALAIPGSGAVESLNVSVAAGVILSELYRRHGLAGVVEPTPSEKVWELPPEEALAAAAVEPLVVPATVAAIGADDTTVMGEHTPP